MFSFKGMPTELSKADLSSQHTAGLGEFNLSEVTNTWNLPSCLDDSEALNINYTKKQLGLIIIVEQNLFFQFLS